MHTFGIGNLSFTIINSGNHLKSKSYNFTPLLRAEEYTKLISSVIISINM